MKFVNYFPIEIAICCAPSSAALNAGANVWPFVIRHDSIGWMTVLSNVFNREIIIVIFISISSVVMPCIKCHIIDKIYCHSLLILILNALCRSASFVCHTTKISKRAMPSTSASTQVANCRCWRNSLSSYNISHQIFFRRFVSAKNTFISFRLAIMDGVMHVYVQLESIECINASSHTKRHDLVHVCCVYWLPIVFLFHSCPLSLFPSL